jgi:TonB family protein
MSPASTFNIGSGWHGHKSSFGTDFLSLVFAIGLHLPLVFMKFDTTKKAVDRPGERLVSVDLIEADKPKPVEEVQAPPPPAPKQNTLMSKLKAMVRKEPPPPPPPAAKPIPEKLAEAPKPLALQPKLDLPKVQPTLESKAGFKTQADAKLVEQQQKLANAPVAGIAPLSAKKLGINDNRAAVKNSKGNFQISQNESLKGIGDGPSLANAAPAIAIRTSKSGTTENFSAPVTQKTDKGRIGAIPGGDLGGGPKLGLRDQIIARDAAPAQIGGRPGGVPGGIPGGTGSKRDAGRFQGDAGAPGGKIGGIAPAAPVGSITTSAAKKREKPSMFSITGALADRKIEKQVAPEYPAWAQEQGISASVVLEFTVDPNGYVKNSIVVRRTSGSPKLDETAIKALRQWKFVALPDGSNRDEVGMITFNYSLS